MDTASIAAPASEPVPAIPGGLDHGGAVGRGGQGEALTILLELREGSFLCSEPVECRHHGGHDAQLGWERPGIRHEQQIAGWGALQIGLLDQVDEVGFLNVRFQSTVVRSW